VDAAAQKRIAGLSPDKREWLEKRLEGRTIGRGHGITPRPRTGNLPLSFSQQRLWFVSQMAPSSSFYNLNVAIRLAVYFDPPILERTLNEIVRRHESLRTTFGVMDGQAVQVIAPALVIRLREVDLRSNPERESEAMRLATEEAIQPFDLTRGPLIRASLLEMGEADSILLVTLHHIISDGWSVNVLFGELSAIYTAYAAGQESPLKELPIQYADFALWQREWLKGEVLEKQLEYWRHIAGTA